MSKNLEAKMKRKIIKSFMADFDKANIWAQAQLLTKNFKKYYEGATNEKN